MLKKTAYRVNQIFLGSAPKALTRKGFRPGLPLI